MKTKIIIKILISIIIMFISINSVKPLIRNLVEEDYTPIELRQANRKQLDLNMAISHLYNISKEQHPTGSKANYKVKDYIVMQLDKMNVDYEIQTFNYTYDEIYIKKLNALKDIKNEAYKSLKENLKKNSLNFEEGLTQLGYDNFDKYYQDNILEGKTIEQVAREATNNSTNMEYFWNKETNESANLNNILIKLGNTNADSKAVLFIAHYDSVPVSFGAGDDGITVSSILEMIRHIKDNEFENTIYVLLTDGEEIGVLGAEYFNDNNLIMQDISLVINIDNAGASGSLFLYQVSNNNSNLIESYLKATSEDNTYSFTNKAYDYIDWYNTDADIFLENGYNVLNLSLISNRENYHSENDLLYNIDKNTIKNMMNTITDMAVYYGNCELKDYSLGTKLFYMKLWDGIVLCIPEIIYSILTIAIILISLIYSVVKVIKTKSINFDKIFLIILTVFSIICYLVIKDLTFIFTIPILFILIEKLIKNENLKQIYMYISYLIYLIISMQVFALIYIVFNKNGITILLGIITIATFIIICYSKHVLYKKQT